MPQDDVRRFDDEPPRYQDTLERRGPGTDAEGAGSPSGVPPLPERTRKPWGCLKWFVVLASVTFLGTLICCGSAVYIIYPETEQNPAVIKAVAEEVLGTSIPASFTPKVGLKMNFYWLARMQAALFEHQSGRGGLGVFNFLVEINDGEDLQSQLRDEFAKSRLNEKKALNVTETEKVPIEIDGKTVEFVIEAGEDVSSKTKYRQVQGEFVKGKRLIYFDLQLEEEVWQTEEAAIRELLKSLK